MGHKMLLRQLLSRCARAYNSVYRNVIFIVRLCDNWMHRNMKYGTRHILATGRFCLSLLVMFVLVFGDIVSLPAPFDHLISPHRAEAAQSTIDATTHTTPTSHIAGGPQTVFISDLVGYKFYRDSTGVCGYARTTDGGINWGGFVTTDSKTTCFSISVWYDGWTPGSTSTQIQIATLDTVTSQAWYNALNTNNASNTLIASTSINAASNSGQTGTLLLGSNYVTVTKGTDGTVYIATDDNTDSYVVECTTNCNLTTGWIEAGIRPQDLAPNFTTLVPLLGGNIMLINRDITSVPNTVRYKVWNNTLWSASWALIDGNAPLNTTYDVGMSVVVSSSTKQIYIGYVSDNVTLGTDDDIRVGRYNGSTWSTSTPVLNDAKGLTGVAITLDQNNDDVYLAYTGATTPATVTTQNVYYRTSTSTMSSFSAEKGPINTTASDMYGVFLNGTARDRVYATWHDNTLNDIYGDTIADIAPGIKLSTTTTSQTATVRASTTGFYIGTPFMIRENTRARNITSMTLTEKGTIDAQNALKNIKLFYESDTTQPLDCASETFNGTETQFGSTNTGGFSSANGTSTFSGTMTTATSSVLCVYPVMDVTNAAVDLSTIDVEITNPVTDVSFTLGDEIIGTTTVALAGSTTVYNDNSTEPHYHWRNDNGTETTATSATGAEDTPYSAFPLATPKRLRVEVANKGSTTTLPMQYRLEYGAKTTSCSAVNAWVDVGAVGGDWDMFNSPNLTDGNNTTNISTASGGVTDDTTTFLVANAGQKDTSSQTSTLTLSTTTFAEIEYSVVPTGSAIAGNSYCFRVTDASVPLDFYTQYPEATMASDLLVVATGTQKTTIDIPATTTIGTVFVVSSPTGTTSSITSITLTASGTVDYRNNISNVKLQYDLDTTAPYDCASESYAGTEARFGATSTNGFSSTATTTFTGSVSVTATQSMCLYTVVTVNSTAINTNTFNVLIANPPTDIVRTVGTVGPSTGVNVASLTTLVKSIPTQIHYHFRNDDGSEAAATSQTGGVEDTNVTNFIKGTSTRLRVEVSNKGASTTPSVQFRLEYAHKISSCSAASSWIDVGATGGDWDMFNSPNITDGSNVTNIAVGTGGTTDDNITFLAANAGQKDTSSQTSALTLATTTFTEIEYSIISSTTVAADNSTYCFRVTNAGTPLESYVRYPELSLKNNTDFKIQRGVTVIGDNGIATKVITAGVDYVAPLASTSAFIRITNTQLTGAGATSAPATQNAKDVTAYILNPWNIGTSITFQRVAAGAVASTRIAWEIVEYIGPAGGDNEMKVRQQQAVTYGAASTTATGTAVSGVTDNTKVAVFITGAWNPDVAATNYDSMLATSDWSTTTQSAFFVRGTSGADAVILSYAVVEFTGANWKIQRVAHTYSSTSTETQSITAVNSISRTFLHVQKRISSLLNSHANFGHEVWLSSVGAVSFQLDTMASTSANHTSVAWVIENTQTKGSAMIVTRSNGTQTGGAQPLAVSVSIGKTLSDLTIASIFTNNRSTGSGTPTFPEPIMMVSLISTSTTNYQLWVSNTGETRTYRTEVVEWPTAQRSIAQNYYRLYANNDALTPSDPWPVGVIDLGENTAMTGLDQPTSNTSAVRIRMSISMNGQSSMPPGIDAFKLQYGKRITASCSAIATWQDTGDSASTTAQWRGHSTPVTDGTLLSGNPPTIGDLKLSVSDKSGTYDTTNPTPLTSYIVKNGEDMEFDWSVENNNADSKASYCFRMVESDGTLFNTYNFYPTIKTIGYGAESKKWRWYDDSQNETPTVPLAGETVTPIDVTYNNSIALRLTLKESNGALGTNVKFKLQFSESPTFDTVTDVSGTSTCADNTSLWCYAAGGGVDNAVITTALLSDADACVAGSGRGCGIHNASGTSPSTYNQPATSSAEFSFSIRHAGARVNRTYYFRAYDVINSVAILTAAGASYPSLTTFGSSLTFAVSGVATSTVVEGVTTDVATTPTSIPFGSFTGSSTKNAAYQFNVTTDSTEGYQVFVYQSQGLISNKGGVITPVTASNTSPGGWATVCATSATGCFGYHAGDDTLAGGSARFAPDDTYAALSTSPAEIAQSSIPVTNDVVTVIYRITTRGLQEAGAYTTNLTYIVVPIF